MQIDIEQQLRRLAWLRERQGKWQAADMPLMEAYEKGQADELERMIHLLETKAAAVSGN